MATVMASPLVQQPQTPQIITDFGYNPDVDINPQGPALTVDWAIDDLTQQSGTSSKVIDFTQQSANDLTQQSNDDFTQQSNDDLTQQSNDYIDLTQQTTKSKKIIDATVLVNDESQNTIRCNAGQWSRIRLVLFKADYMNTYELGI